MILLRLELDQDFNNCLSRLKSIQLMLNYMSTARTLSLCGHHVIPKQINEEKSTKETERCVPLIARLKMGDR